MFTNNAAQLTEELQRLDTWIEQQIQTIPPSKRQLVTTHDAFQYYANAYGLEVAGTLIGISTEEQPSAQTVKNLADEIIKTKVPAIFRSSEYRSSVVQDRLLAPIPNCSVEKDKEEKEEIDKDKT